MGPPCEGGHLLIRSPRVDSGNDRGSPGGGRRRTGDTGDDIARVLRLAVSIRAGPPAKVLIRSPALGVEEFTSEIRTTQLAGFKVGGCSSGWTLFWMDVTSTCWVLYLLLYYIGSLFLSLKLERSVFHDYFLPVVTWCFSSVCRRNIRTENNPTSPLIQYTML